MIDKLKQQAIDTEVFMILVDSLNAEAGEAPKTEKGLATKTKEIREKVEKKMLKLSDDEKMVLINNKRKNAGNAKFEESRVDDDE